MVDWQASGARESRTRCAMRAGSPPLSHAFQLSPLSLFLSFRTPPSHQTSRFAMVWHVQPTECATPSTLLPPRIPVVWRQRLGTAPTAAAVQDGRRRTQKMPIFEILEGGKGSDGREARLWNTRSRSTPSRCLPPLRGWGRRRACRVMSRLAVGFVGQRHV